MKRLRKLLAAVIFVALQCVFGPALLLHRLTGWCMEILEGLWSPVRRWSGWGSK